MQVEPYVTHAILQILCDTLAYSVTDNIFSDNTKGRVSVEQELVVPFAQEVRNFIQSKSVVDWENLSPLKDSPHLLYDSIAIVKAHLDEIKYSSIEEFNNLVRHWYKFYWKYELDYMKGKKLVVMQAETDNTFRTVALNMQRKKTLKLSSSAALSELRKAYIEYVNKEIGDFIPLDMTKPYPIGSYIGVSSRFFEADPLKHGLYLYDLDAVDDISNDGESVTKVLASELYGDTKILLAHDISLTNLHKYVTVCDDVFLQRWSNGECSILLPFIEEDLKSLKLSEEIKFEEPNYNKMWLNYKHMINFTVTLVTKSNNIEELLNKFPMWRDTYIVYVSNAVVKPSLPYMKPFKSISSNTGYEEQKLEEAYSAMLLAVIEILHVRQQLDSMGYKLIDAEIYPIRTVKKTRSLLHHLNEKYGEKRSYYLNDPSLINIENLPTNDENYRKLVDKYKKFLPSIIATDVSNISSLKLINVYDYTNKANEEDTPPNNEDKKDKLTLFNLKNKVNNQSENVNNSSLFELYMNSIKVLCPTRTTAEDYFEYLSNPINKKLPRSVNMVLQEMTKKLLEKEGKEVGIFQIQENINANTKVLLNSYNSNIVRIYEAIAKFMNLHVDLDTSYPYVNVCNKLLVLQNILYLYETMDDYEPIEVISSNDHLTMLANIMRTLESSKQNNLYKFKFPSGLTESECVALERHIVNLLPNNHKYISYSRSRDRLISVFDNKLKNTIGTNVNTSRAVQIINLNYSVSKKAMKEYQDNVEDYLKDKKVLFDNKRLHNLVEPTNNEHMEYDEYGFIRIKGVPYVIIGSYDTISYIHKTGGEVKCKLKSSEIQIIREAVKKLYY